jgi:uncharacterized RDD family membrane protein YckC
MTSFREYRAEMAEGENPDRRIPDLPSDAIPYQGQRAGFISRAVAASIDVVIVFLVVLGTAAAIWMVSIITQPISPGTAPIQSGDRLPDIGFFILYGYCLNVLYWTVGWATGGRTIGNLVMGLRVVNHKGERVRWAGAFLRALFCTIFVPGLFWVIVSGANRSVQDVVLRTSVIYDWVIGIPGLSNKAGSPARTTPAP